MNDLFLTDQELQRREELKRLLELNIDPYPSATFPINTTTHTIQTEFQDGSTDFQDISIAGRLINKRVMGKASFAELQDSYGKIQLYFQRDDISPEEDKTMYNEVFKKLISNGDIVGIKGYAFLTKTGEKTIHVKNFQILSKILKPIPFPKETDDKTYDTLTDTEQRYRMRYLDMIVHPEVRETFRKRSQVIQEIRNFLNEKGYLEVETPILQPIYGGAAARPFKTHHNSLDMTLYLRIANELYLKRLIVGGFDGVYEFAKDFRNEGMSRFHNPEFTMMELYVAYKDYDWMMELVEEMIERVVLAIHQTTKITVGGEEIDFQRPWKRYTMYEAIEAFTNIDVSEMDEEKLREVADKLSVPIDQTMGRGKLIDEIFGEKVEPFLLNPTFITDYPVEMSPLAKKHRNKEDLVERFEAICNRKELCNAFSELNDPLDQRTRFESQLELGKRGDEEAMVLDEDYLRALSYGLPPTAGLGIGIDRLCMIMTDSVSIQDVLFFPQMKAEKKPNIDSVEEFMVLGVPKEWVEMIYRLGILNLKDLSEQKDGKLFQDLCGINKKMKAKLKNPSKEEVSGWIEEAINKSS